MNLTYYNLKHSVKSLKPVNTRNKFLKLPDRNVTYAISFFRSTCLPEKIYQTAAIANKLNRNRQLNTLPKYYINTLNCPN